MTKTIEIPDKPRKHKWVTEALSEGKTKLSVWPSPGDLQTESKRERFMQTIAKVGNDPRVHKVEKHMHDVHSVVFLFHLTDD